MATAAATTATVETQALGPSWLKNGDLFLFVVITKGAGRTVVPPLPVTCK